jgi:hypothetical protein
MVRRDAVLGQGSGPRKKEGLMGATRCQRGRGGGDTDLGGGEELGRGLLFGLGQRVAPRPL